MQSCRHSAVESLTNVGAGLVIGYSLNLWLLPLTATQAAGLSALYTVLSLVRSYAVRRVFVRLGVG